MDGSGYEFQYNSDIETQNWDENKVGLGFCLAGIRISIIQSMKHC